MVTKLKIENFDCHCVNFIGSDTILYLIYPALVEFDDNWLERMSKDLKIPMAAVYVPANLWNDVLTPWPEPGEAPGFPPFGGKAKEFLELLTSKIIPSIENELGLSANTTRDLMGVSLSGLFALWQWMESDVFHSIACLSGSFWYEGFRNWFESLKIPGKTGKAYFLLGKEEPLAHIKAYQTVGINTEMVVERLKEAGIPVEFEWVPGNHFSKPVHRAQRALQALFTPFPTH